MRNSKIGKKLSNETRKNISESNKGKHKLSDYNRKKLFEANKGRKLSKEHKVKLSKAKLGNIPWNKGIKGFLAGDKSPHWIKDRNELKTDREKAYDSKYKIWMRAVKGRDNWKCRIDNSDCKGRLEAHHILPWSEFPELRYEINNGICLCHYHHPRSKKETKRLTPVFKKMVETNLIVGK